MAKKKRQLQPVARGFAVTSIPKKAPQVEESTEQATEETQLESSTPPPQLQSTTEHEVNAEVVALQALVEKLQDKTSREVAR